MKTRLCLLVLVAAGCTEVRTTEPAINSSGGSGASTGGADPSTPTTPGSDDNDGSSSQGSTSSNEPKLDVGSMPDLGPGAVCSIPEAVPCDHLDDDPWHAIGLNCPGGVQVDGTMPEHAEAFLVHTGPIGTHEPPAFPPREGEKVLILSTGFAETLLMPGEFSSTHLPGLDLLNLPAPMIAQGVGPQTCTEDPSLIGTGDCSNTIEDQWFQGYGAHDYTEVRFTATVPDGAQGLAFDFAMFNTEYPDYYQSIFNDMFIVWLESETWTGNIAFDDDGDPITLNAGFHDYKDAPNDIDCPDPCEAPELAGTAMEGHAATRWLTTQAAVTPKDEIEVIFSVFDVSDERLDAFIALDGWRWTCEGGAPSTRPAG